MCVRVGVVWFWYFFRPIGFKDPCFNTTNRSSPFFSTWKNAPRLTAKPATQPHSSMRKTKNFRNFVPRTVSPLTPWSRERQSRKPNDRRTFLDDFVGGNFWRNNNVFIYIYIDVYLYSQWFNYSMNLCHLENLGTDLDDVQLPSKVLK